jgi:hypothetical protein
MQSLSKVLSLVIEIWVLDAYVVFWGMFSLKALCWGQQGARENYSLQIQDIVDHSYKVLGWKPILIGECGILMDIK